MNFFFFFQNNLTTSQIVEDEVDRCNLEFDIVDILEFDIVDILEFDDLMNRIF